MTTDSTATPVGGRVPGPRTPPGAAPLEPAGTPDQGATRLHPVVGALLVFLSSAAVLVVEIVAMRLVAPYVGVTLQTSSAVIGVALSAMALGAWVGGRLADRRSPTRLLAPILVAAGVLTALTVPAVRTVDGWLSDTSAAPAVLALAVAAVFAPAATLSTISPMVVKMQLADLGRTGSVVGRLSGTGTLGAITSTFLTGFVLLAHVRTTTIMIGTGLVLLATGLALLVRRPDPKVAISAFVAVPLMPWLFAATPDPCQFETAYHCGRIDEQAGMPGVRQLQLDTLTHSEVDLDDPTVLAFPYVQAMNAAVDAVRPARTAISGLYIGAGAMTLPRFQAATRPGSSARVLEIDPGVVDADRRWLGTADIPDLTVGIGDARTALRQGDSRYDVVVGDAFGGVAVPWHLTTAEAATDIRRVMKADGVYVVNVIDFGPDHFARAEVATLRTVFAHVVVAADAAFLAGHGTGGNHVVMASSAPLPVARIQELLRRSTPNWQLLDEAATASFAGGAQVLTDDDAPVDQLVTPHPNA